MTQTGNWFFALLRFALWGTTDGLPQQLDAETVEDILYEAGDQTVTGLVADALMNSGVQIPPSLIPKLYGTTFKVEMANEQFNNGLKEFVSLGIPDYAVVKGQTIAALYPKPALRKPGDIDFIVRDYALARTILSEKWQVELPERLIEKEFAFVHNGIDYEIHDALIAFGSKRNREYWDNLMQRPFSTVQVADTQVCTLEPTLYAVYVFIHLFFHFLREGIGIRHLCDWAIVLHHYRAQINREELLQILRQLDFHDAYKAFGAILVKYLAVNCFPLPLDDSDFQWAEQVLPDILHGGNFGKNIKRGHSSDFAIKLETFRRTLRVSVRYRKLAPTEINRLVLKLIRVNLKLLFAAK